MNEGQQDKPNQSFFCQVFPLPFILLFSFLSSSVSSSFSPSINYSKFIGRGCQLFPLLIDFIFASAKYFSLKTSANLNGFQQKANLLGKTTFSVFPFDRKLNRSHLRFIYCKNISLPNQKKTDLSFYCPKMNHLQNISLQQHRSRWVGHMSISFPV